MDVRFPFRRMTRTPRAQNALHTFAESKTAILVFIAMWAIGLAALAIVIRFQNQVERENQAQVVVQTLQRQVGDLTVIAFGPALAVHGFGLTAAQNRLRLQSGEHAMVSTLSRLTGNAEYRPTQARVKAYLPGLDRLAAVVAKSTTAQAALAFGHLSRPGGS
jgi:hypothetical protein